MVGAICRGSGSRRSGSSSLDLETSGIGGSFLHLLKFLPDSGPSTDACCCSRTLLAAQILPYLRCMSFKQTSGACAARLKKFRSQTGLLARQRVRRWQQYIWIY